jgi:hypothetical protein
MNNNQIIKKCSTPGQREKIGIERSKVRWGAGGGDNVD